MSKGVKPPIRKKDPIIKVRQDNPNLDPGIIVDLQPQTCWTFKLVEVTQAALHATSGMFVFGVKQGERILVLADPGTLGFAPSSVVAKINAVLETRGGELRGEIVSIMATKSEIVVKLCLV